MSGEYNKLGIQFLYPENWQITDEDTQSWPRTVSVQSPAGGFWSLMVYDDEDPSRLTQEVVSTMKTEYEDLEANGVNEEFDDLELSGYEMYFYCHAFVIRARTLAVRAATQTYLLIWQAEDRDYDRLQPVFRAITTSLFAAP